MTGPFLCLKTWIWELWGMRVRELGAQDVGKVVIRVQVKALERLLQPRSTRALRGFAMTEEEDPFAVWEIRRN